MNKEMYIKEPSVELINQYIHMFYDSELNRADEAAVKKVFETFDNTSIDNVLIKTVVLNNRYSTRLNDKPSENSDIAIDVNTISGFIQRHFQKHDSPDEVARFIEELCKDISKSYKKKKPYSFLSKYFFWTYYVDKNSNVEIPIYDRYAKGMIYYLSKKCDYLESFKQSDICMYDSFVFKYNEVHKRINQKLNTNYSVREFDIYLWQYAKYLSKRKPEPIDVGIG